MTADWYLILSGVAALGSAASLVRVSALHRSTDNLTSSLRTLYKEFSSFRASYKAAEDARALWASRIEGQLAGVAKLDATATEMYNKLDAAISDIRELTVAQQRVTEKAEETLRLAQLAWESSQIATETADNAAKSITGLAAERRQQR